MASRSLSVPLGLAFGLLVATGSPAHADTGNVRSAAEEFDAGRKAYRAGDYAEAGRRFEAAYVDAPNPEALRSAIVARHKAKQLARAATLAAHGERAHPDDAALAAASTEVLAAAKPALGSFVALCTPTCAVVVDGQLGSIVDDTTVTVYLEPGPHRIKVEWPEKGTRAFDVEATPGSLRSETVVRPAASPPPPASPVVAPPAPALAPATPPPQPARKPLPKGLFVVGVGLTVAAGAATLVSGVLALSSPGKDAVRRACAGLDTSCPQYQSGQNAELRTNVLIGTTVGLAVVTTAIAFFTDFGGRAARRATAVPYVDPITRTGGVSVRF